jgi:D-alanyl-D-alanine carboxypeptidase (penicillin-binding protein 5/6)
MCNRWLIPPFISLLLSLTGLAQEPESVMAVEAYSGKILVAANATKKRPVASLTKIATAVITVDWATATGTDLGTCYATVPDSILQVGGPNPMSLQPGDTITLRDALYSALLGSDNLAAQTVAAHVGAELLRHRGRTGDPVAAFVTEMNHLADGLGMGSTKFANPHGLEFPHQKGYSTAADMAKLSVYAMRKPAFTFIVRQKERQISVKGAAGTRAFRLRNTNELLGDPGVVGIKTGTTSLAGPCLATCMERDPVVRLKPDGQKGVTPRRLIVVVLNSADRFGRTRSLLSQAWPMYDTWLEQGAQIEDRKREILPIQDPR